VRFDSPLHRNTTAGKSGLERLEPYQVRDDKTAPSSDQNEANLQIERKGESDRCHESKILQTFFV